MIVYFDYDPIIRAELARVSCAIIPIGSIEQHGHHLPVSTDSIIVEYIARELSNKVNAFVLPTVNYGISFEHDPLFNISIGHDTLLNMLYDIVVSLSNRGINNIIILNGHHGNSGIIQYVSEKIYRNLSKVIRIYPINYWHLSSFGFDHAGKIETSLMLSVAPQLVNMANAQPSTKQFVKSKIFYSSITTIPMSFPAITGNGVWGNPLESSEKFGKEVISEILTNLESLIIDLIGE